jgi:hypothetical protein
VVRGEGTRQRAAVERLEDRRLHLEEAALVEPAADSADDLGAEDEELACLGVGKQVNFSMPIPGLDILDPVILLGHRTQ